MGGGGVGGERCRARGWGGGVSRVKETLAMFSQRKYVHE